MPGHFPAGPGKECLVGFARSARERADSGDCSFEDFGDGKRSLAVHYPTLAISIAKPRHPEIDDEVER